MSHFLHSTTWTVGGLLAVLWIGLMLTALPAAVRIRAEKKARSYEESGDVEVPAPRAAACTTSRVARADVVGDRSHE